MNETLNHFVSRQEENNDTMIRHNSNKNSSNQVMTQFSATKMSAKMLIYDNHDYYYSSFFFGLIQCTKKFKYKIVASNVTQFNEILFSSFF